jgi:predicted PurR-regulated permease PerM
VADGAGQPDVSGRAAADAAADDGGSAGSDRGAADGADGTDDSEGEHRAEHAAPPLGSDAPRRERLFAAASARGVPLRTILAVDAVVIATFVLYRLVGRLREVILWILIAAFISAVLNPSVLFLQRRGFRRGSAVGLVFVGAIAVFFGLLGLLGYPLVNSLTHVAERLPTMVNDVEKGHGWLAHELKRLGLLSWVQKNAPKLKTFAHSLGKPALTVGTNLGKAVFSTILALTTIAFLSLFMLLEAPGLRKGLLGTLAPERRREVEEIGHQVSRQVSSYVLGTIALSLMFGVVIFVTLVVLGVPFALLIGLWVALVAMIPLVGGLIAAVPSVALALLHSPTAGIVTLVVFVAFQLVENHFIYPVVMSRSVRMNPLWVLLAVLVGANLGGVFGSSLGALAGALVAIPVGSAIQVVFREVWARTRPQPAPAGGPLVTGGPPDPEVASPALGNGEAPSGEIEVHGDEPARVDGGAG